MKTLILAENSDFSHDLEKIILKNNCSPIIYHSALKALDNIEEIAPEILIVHTGDFPRHWKTLIQYTQTLFPQRQVAIYLFVSDYFSQKEQEKAHHYHATMFKSVEEFETIFSQKGMQKNSSQESKAQDFFEKDSCEENDTTKKIFLRNEKLHISLQGTIETINYPKVSFSLLCNEDRKKLRFGQIFNHIEITLKNTQKVFRGQIQGLGNYIEVCLL